jgi:Ca2+/Na+ antiporter
MRIEKPEKIVGYVVLVVEFIFIILAVILACLLVSSGTQIPEFVQIPTEGEFAKAVATVSNVYLVFFILIIIIWAGSRISSRGITLIKEIKLKIVEGNLGEEVQIIKKGKT